MPRVVHELTRPDARVGTRTPAGSLVHKVSVSFVGVVSIGYIDWVWPFDKDSEILTIETALCTASTGAGSTDVDVEQGDGTTWASVFDAAANQPQIEAGDYRNTVGGVITPVAPDLPAVAAGDMIRVEVVDITGTADEEGLTVKVVYQEVG